jgi:hypothetical protein
MLALKYKVNIDDHMTQKSYYNIKLGLTYLALLGQIAFDLLS